MTSFEIFSTLSHRFDIVNTCFLPRTVKRSENTDKIVQKAFPQRRSYYNIGIKHAADSRRGVCGYSKVLFDVLYKECF